MGRRISIVTGLLLTLSCLPAQGQDQKAEANSKEGAAAASLPPITPAGTIKAAPDPTANLALPPVDEFPPLDTRAAPGAGRSVMEAPRAVSAKKGGRQASVRRDRDLKQAQAAGDPPAQTAPPATPPVQAPAPPAADLGPAPVTAPGESHSEGSGFVLPPDRLPLGKQEVVLSVDVQAPANLNFNREATVKIVVRNSGSSDALGVVVRDELPAGLLHISAQPEAQKVGESLLAWRITTLPAGSERIILLKVKPTKTGGAVDHAATVTFQAGSKATSRVLRPRLKLEVVQTPADGKVLKNKTAQFRIAVTNSGDGPVRGVTVQAKLSPGLRHDTGERNEDNSFELPIQELGPGQREDLDPLTVDAIQGGEQWCRVTVTSTDVDFDKEAAQVSRTLDVVEPKLKMTLTGPDKRYTDTVAPYAITLENPGTAPARNVKVLATLGVSGRLVAVPPGAKYDSASRRLQWTISQIDPAEKPRTFPFEIRMGGISAYEINVEARGDNALYVKDRRITDVQGMPDVDLVVRERRRVVDVDGTTTFQIRLRNYGTKEATKLQISAKLSENLVVTDVAGGPQEDAYASPKRDEVKFPIIERLGPGKEMLLGIKVKVTKPQPKIGTCRVYLLHDDLSEPLEDMAGVKVTESRRAITGP
jgi:uncharacterized repeat protein (TIGR01451 family)